MSTVLPDRLRDAREWMGFSREQAAGALGLDPLTLAQMETGDAEPTAGQMEKFGRLYRRPLAWFSGETRFTPSPDLLRMAERLGPVDRAVVLEFAEWLEGAGPPPDITRKADS